MKLLSLSEKYNNFIDSCYVKDIGYKLTYNSEVSSYALCFAIFGKHLLKDEKYIESNRDLFDKILRTNLQKKRDECLENILTSKPYLQLLTFTLSSLHILGTLSNDPLEKTILEIINNNPIAILKKSGVFTGKPGSGNLAMFYGVLLIHARDYLNISTESEIDTWIKKHITTMNVNGFWGDSKIKPYLQFQNGYHQYEIIDYLRIERPHVASELIAKLVDSDGRFAPYPGGGGCYDYDAIYMLTRDNTNKYDEILKKTLASISSSQNSDGGFPESYYIRPLNYINLYKMAGHVVASNKESFYERARHCLTLLRSKNNKISTHWSLYNREWSESDLWDSWFRMLTIARIRIYLGVDSISDWGFIDYSGIGHHEKLRKK